MQIRVGRTTASARRCSSAPRTAAYIAYQRAGNRNEEADSLVIVGRSFGDRRVWRPALDALRLSLELREVADVRALYEKMREDHGFRLLDYTVDSDSASPRACFQFSEELPGKRTDFSPFVAVAGMDKPALSADDKQLCVEGLKHGERYSVTLRAGLPSTVKETLSKSADLTIYVRDRKPFARFAGKAYVLPRTGQRGIPVVSVNTKAVNIAVYRIGDRNLIETVLGRDFQRNLEPYDIERLTESRGIKVWSGELAVEQTLNAEVTTAFPVDQAVGDMAPGVYVMTADAKGTTTDNYDSLSTQWFIVSDLGLAAYSGNDGINVFVNSLATTEPKGQVEVRLMSRGNEVLGTKRSDAAGRVQFEAGLARGEGALSPAMLVATDARGDYAFLNLKGPAFDLSDRGVAGPPGRRRGSMPSSTPSAASIAPARPCTSRRCCATRRASAALNVPLTLVVERPDGLEYRRVAVRRSGRRRPFARACRSTRRPRPAPGGCAPSPIRSVRRSARPPSWSRTMCRIGWSSISRRRPGKIARDTPAKLTVDGRYLYGAPASAPRSRRRDRRVRPAKERPGFAGYQFGLADEEVATDRQPLEDLPQTDDKGKASFEVALDKLPATTRPLEAQGDRAAGRSRRPRGRAQDHAAGRRRRQHDRREAAVLRPLARRGRDRELRRGAGRARRQDARRAAGCATNCSRSSRAISGTAATAAGTTSRSSSPAASPTARIDVAADQPGRISAPVQWGRYRLEVSSADADGPITSIGFDAGFYTEATRRHARHAGDRARQAGVQAGRDHDGRGHRAHRGPRHAQRDGRQAAAAPSRRRCRPAPRASASSRPDWGTGAYVVATLRRPLDARAQRMPGRAIGVQWFSIDRKAHTLALDMKLPPLQRPNTTLRVPIKIDGLGWRGGARRGRRGRCRHPQSHQLQAAGAGRLLSRPAPALRRAARSLRPADRRHAGHARPDPDRRRRRRPS